MVCYCENLKQVSYETCSYCAYHHLQTFQKPVSLIKKTNLYPMIGIKSLHQDINTRRRFHLCHTAVSTIKEKVSFGVEDGGVAVSGLWHQHSLSLEMQNFFQL